MGGVSPERNISLFGGKAIYNALADKGHNVIAVDPALGTDSKININEIDINTTPITREELKEYDKRSILNCINSDIFDNIDCHTLLVLNWVEYICISCYEHINSIALAIDPF